MDCVQGMKQYPDNYFDAAEKRFNNFKLQLNLF